MGVEFLDKSLRRVYKPEFTNNSHLEMIQEVKKLSKETDGYTSKLKTRRLEAKVPLSVLYNYCMSKGIAPIKHVSFMQNRKNFKQFLTDFPQFQMVDKL